ncbi:MAG: hypothetical protein K5925_06290 [Bacilli bacterium]|nr:hypothetical protein [Bacilli bacterium]
MKKYRVATWRIVWRFLVVLLIIYVILFSALSSLFIAFDSSSGTFYAIPWDYHQPMVIGIALAAGLGIFIPTLFSYYYMIEDKYFIMKKFGKEYQFEYKNIEFVDINESKRKNMAIFYSSKAKMRYLLGDKNGVLVETLIKKCPNTMSVEEFRRKHPEEKY